MNGETILAMALVLVAVLLPACYFDHRYRQVPNVFWWVVGIIGIVFTVFRLIDLSSFKVQYALCIAGAVLILLDMLWFDIREARTQAVLYIVIALCFVIPCIADFDYVSKNYLLIFVVYAVMMVFYRFGIIRGGADVKCIVTISMVFQTCPAFMELPLIPVPQSVELFFPFAIVVLFYAALLSLLVLFQIVLRKLGRKNDPVSMINISCYSMSIQEARRSHVWAKQDVKDGMVVNIDYIPDEGVYDRLEAAGAKTVWVTPIIPFIIPITVATVIALFVGNVFFIPFG